jgi:hypothetical protein
MPQFVFSSCETTSAGLVLQRKSSARQVLSAAAQLAVVILNVAALLIVVQRSVFRFAVLLLATGREGVAVHLNILAGLVVGAARSAVIAVPVMIAVAIVIVVPVAIVVGITSTVVATSVSAVWSIAAAVVPRTLEVAIDVLNLAAAAIVIAELG